MGNMFLSRSVFVVENPNQHPNRAKNRKRVSKVKVISASSDNESKTRATTLPRQSFAGGIGTGRAFLSSLLIFQSWQAMTVPTPTFQQRNENRDCAPSADGTRIASALAAVSDN